MCYLCSILIGFVARSNISLGGMNLNQTGLGFVWLAPGGNSRVVHKDSNWQQSATSCKFDQHLKANKCVLYEGRGLGCVFSSSWFSNGGGKQIYTHRLAFVGMLCMCVHVWELRVPAVWLEVCLGGCCSYWHCHFTLNLWWGFTWITSLRVWLMTRPDFRVNQDDFLFF